MEIERSYTHIRDHWKLEQYINCNIEWQEILKNRVLKGGSICSNCKTRWKNNNFKSTCCHACDEHVQPYLSNPINKKHVEKYIPIQYHKYIFEHTITIYTDGSCIGNPGRGGWAFIAIFPDCEIHYSGREEDTTNNKMELTAVIQALETFPTTKEILIYTDSQYVIKCATGEYQRKKNLELWERYEKSRKGRIIKYEWVRGHMNEVSDKYKYNNLVDEMARKETRLETHK